MALAEDAGLVVTLRAGARLPRGGRAALLALLVVVAACGREVTLEGAPPDAVSAFPLDAASEGTSAGAVSAGTPPDLHAEGSIDARPLSTVLYSELDSEVTARTEGVVRSLAAELGDAVQEGQVLALLDDARESAQAAAAEAALELARMEHARAVELRAHDLATAAELDAATYRLRAAEAAARIANVELEFTRVRAPFSGTVSRRFVRAGQTVAVGSAVFRVTALAPLRAQLRLPESAARGLRRGEEVWLTSPDGRRARGAIARVAPTVDASSGTVEILVDVQDAGGLQPGAAVTAQIGSRAPTP